MIKWVDNMKLKKIVLIAFMLLAIIMIGAVSAADDADALAADDIGGEVSEAPIDVDLANNVNEDDLAVIDEDAVAADENIGSLSDPSKDDFNFKVNGEVELDNSSVVLSWNWPSGISYTNGHMSISCNGNFKTFNDDFADSKNVTIKDLGISEPKTYDFSAIYYYGDDKSFSVASGSFKVTKSGADPDPVPVPDPVPDNGTAPEGNGTPDSSSNASGSSSSSSSSGISGTSGSSNVDDSNKVTKTATKIIAKKKTFKVKVKVKKYTVTLKTSKNKLIKNAKLTLKVNKKTITAKTNKKGIATFKIKNLKKKGTYKITVKYAGNSSYKAKTVKQKIIVK